MRQHDSTNSSEGVKIIYQSSFGLVQGALAGKTKRCVFQIPREMQCGLHSYVAPGLHKREKQATTGPEFWAL